MGVNASAIERKTEVSAEDTGAFVRREAQKGRFGGARADFVASLGRRTVELSTSLANWQDDPRSVADRDDLSRRVHALAAGARLLRFVDLADKLTACETRIQTITTKGELLLEDVTTLRRAFEALPALAWAHDEPAVDARGASSPSLLVAGEPKARAGDAPAAEVEVTFPHTALVVGPDSLADALTYEIGDDHDSAADGSVRFDVERTEDPTVAIDLARAFAPDVVIVDDDMRGAPQLIEAILTDPLTESVPVIVLGRFDKAEDASAYVALGVARALPKPVSPDALRRACADVTATYVRREVVRSPLGAMSVDELGSRLAEELRKGLCDAAAAKGRAARVDLGEGSDVLAALWGAVARIRDLVTIRSDGQVRFSPSGPEGALPLASWMTPPEVSTSVGRARSAKDARTASAHPLDKAVIVIADDDPAVTWFFAGILKSAGAIVHEARDGARARELAFRVAPDLVISDVLMPELDGFALCRSLKHDLVLRDVPVILLSWKEDLLQRVRELGASADGYMRKEASAAAVIQRVREVMRPRARVAERLAAGGEVRGRLDGLTTHTLLGLTCARRPTSRITVRDATFLYEVEVRKGQPIRATRTSTDGSFERGPAVLAALLGVGAGRFVVEPLTADDELAPVRHELSGPLGEQLQPLVAKARAAQRLLTGSALVQVDRVTIDEDRIASYVDATPEPARALLRALARGASPRELITSAKAPSRLIEDVLGDVAAHGAVDAVFDAAGNELLAAAIDAEIAILKGARRPLTPADYPEIFIGSPEIEALDDAAELTPGPLLEAYDEEREHTPMVGTRVQAKAPASAPQAKRAEPASAPEEAEASAVLSVVAAESPAPAEVAKLPSGAPVHLGSLKPPPVVAKAPEAPPAIVAPQTIAAQPAPQRVEAQPEPAPQQASRSRRDETPSQPRVPRPSAYLAQAPAAEPPKRDARLWMWIAFAAIGIVFAVAARWAREGRIPEPVAPPAAAPVAAPVVAAPEAPPQPPAPVLDPTAEDLDLRTDDVVADGQGMLEIVAGSGNTIYVDGRLIGKGPVVKVPLAPKAAGAPFEVRVELRGEDQVRFVAVKQGRLTRLRVAPPWSR